MSTSLLRKVLFGGVGLIVIVAITFSHHTYASYGSGSIASPAQDTQTLIQLLLEQIKVLKAQLAVLSSVDREGRSYTWSSTGEEIERDQGPKANPMSCANTEDGARGNGAFACYGLWDGGDEFGDDENMCGDGSYDSRYYLQTGCVIPAKICQSNRAISARHYSVSGASPEKVAQLAKDFRTTEAAVKKNLLGVWEYECTDKPLTGLENPQLNVAALERDYGPKNPDWNFVTSKNNIVVVGIYEPQRDDGTVDVVLSNVNKNSLLVLTAYDATRWRLSGPALRNVKAIFITGYENQQISNVPARVPIKSMIYEQDNGAQVFYAYQKTGPEFFELQDYLSDMTGYKTDVFFGGYSSSTVVVDVNKQH